MASYAKIMEVRAALLNIGDYATDCHDKLARYNDADRDWLLSRADHIDSMLVKLRKVCQEAADEPGGKCG